MTLDELLTSKKISAMQASIYRIFNETPDGQQLLANYIMGTFMADCAEVNKMTEAHLAYLDGRRSVFREIKRNIEHITAMLNEGDVDIEVPGSDADMK